jgi:hypothetical protein
MIFEKKKEGKKIIWYIIVPMGIDGLITRYSSTGRDLTMTLSLTKRFIY